MIKVLIADDHAIVRAGLRALIHSEPTMELTGEATGGFDTIERVEESRPDVLVMDLSMPDLDGISVTRQIKPRFPNLRILILTIHEDEGLLRAALDALEKDPHTQVITIISKPPGARTLARLTQRFKTCTKPVIGCFLGVRAEPREDIAPFQGASTIDDAVRLVIGLAGWEGAREGDELTLQELESVARERSAWSSAQKYLRGLFAGGTFCYQSQQIFQEAGIAVRSNAPLDPKSRLEDSSCSVEHSLVDMGADEFTLGRPHPMIDGTLRRQRILAESRDPQVSVLLLDFILGYNASMDPVGELLDAILEAKRTAQQLGGSLTVVASVCGTDGDPQELGPQVEQLEQAGAIIFRSNARASAFCCALLKGRGG